MGCAQSNNNGSCLFRSIYNCKRNLETLQKGLPSRTTWPRIYLPFRSWEPALLKLMVRVSSSPWNRCRLSFLFVVPARCAHFAYVSYDSPTLNVLYLLFSILFFLLFCFFFLLIFFFHQRLPRIDSSYFRTRAKFGFYQTRLCLMRWSTIVVWQSYKLREDNAMIMSCIIGTFMSVTW